MIHHILNLLCHVIQRGIRKTKSKSFRYDFNIKNNILIVLLPQNLLRKILKTRGAKKRQMTNFSRSGAALASCPNALILYTQNFSENLATAPNCKKFWKLLSAEKEYNKCCKSRSIHTLQTILQKVPNKRKRELTI